MLTMGSYLWPQKMTAHSQEAICLLLAVIWFSIHTSQVYRPCQVGPQRKVELRQCLQLLSNQSWGFKFFHGLIFFYTRDVTFSISCCFFVVCFFISVKNKYFEKWIIWTLDDWGRVYFEKKNLKLPSNLVNI